MIVLPPSDWFPDWTGQTVIIVAGGPSSKRVDLASARGKCRFIAVNNAWELVPWADFLYACDYAWWNCYDGVPDFAGVKVSIERRTIRTWPEIKWLYCSKARDDINYEPNSEIGWGGNSGFGALNMAVKFRPKKIILVGYDCDTRHGVHWHGKHPLGLHNPSPANINRWRRALERAAMSLRKRHFDVVNASDISTLNNFQRVEFAAEIDGLLSEAV